MAEQQSRGGETAEKQRSLDINSASAQEIAERVPGIGQQRAEGLVQNRPYKDWEEVKQKAPGIDQQMVEKLQQSGATIGGDGGSGADGGRSGG